MLAISVYSASARSMVSVKVFKLSRVGDANLLLVVARCFRRSAELFRDGPAPVSPSQFSCIARRNEK